MNNWLKKLGLSLTVGATILTLAACGSGASNADSDKELSGKKLSIGVWGGNSSEEASLDKLISNFEEQTGAKVEKKVYTDYNTQIQADLIGKTAPDVFYVDISMYDFFAEQGALKELDPDEFNDDAFFEPLVDAFSSDGKLYSIPKDMSTLAMYMNTDIFEDTGVSIDEVPETMEELVDWLPTFQEKIDEVYGEGNVFAMSYTPELSRNYHIAQRGGADVVTKDGMANLADKAVVDNLSILTDLKDTGAFVSPQDVGTGWNGEAFGTGKIAMMDEGNWVFETLNEEFSDINFTVKPLPTYKGEKGSMMFSVGWSKYAGTKEDALSSEWIKYVTSEEGMQLWVEGTGTLPSRQDVADAVDIVNNPDLNVHLEAWDYASPWQDGVTLTTISTAYNNYLPTVMSGESTWEEAMQQATDQANSDIKAKK